MQKEFQENPFKNCQLYKIIHCKNMMEPLKYRHKYVLAHSESFHYKIKKIQEVTIYAVRLF